MEWVARAALTVLGLAALINLANGTLGAWLRKVVTLGELPGLPAAGAAGTTPAGTVPSVAPQGGRLIAPVSGARLISGWGAARDGGARTHQGVDLAAPAGTPIVAATSGTVTKAGSRGSKCGLGVTIRDRSGVETLYCHMSSVGVYTGQAVVAGQTIGTVGTTGNATGTTPHLHFEVHPGGGSAVPAEPWLGYGGR